jgi:hypothetical protein
MNELEHRLTKYEDRISKIMDADLDHERVLFAVEGVSTTHIGPDMSPRTTTFVNGGGDFYIVKFSYNVWFTDTDGVSYRLIDGGCGMMLPDNANRLARGFFDFTWNMKRASSQTSYLITGANGDDMVSRQSLGNMERGAFMDVSGQGWRIPMGDRITFRVKPIAYRYGGVEDGTVPVIVDAKFTVNIQMHGYRTGTR